MAQVLVNITGGGLSGVRLLFADFNNDGSYSGAADVAMEMTGMSKPRQRGLRHLMRF